MSAVINLNEFRTKKHIPLVQTPIEAPAPKIIRDRAKVKSSFNVMNGKSVEETFHVKEYRVWRRYAETIFDREYFSSMEKSPDHLIFITGLVHSQKLLYLLLCEEFEFKYVPHGQEALKIWPTHVDVQMPRMVRKSKDLKQRMWIHEIQNVGNNQYQVKLTSDYEGVIEIKSTAAVFVLKEKA